MLLVGLTGGIGSGKSTVSAGLAKRGAVVVDADAIVRELQEPGALVFLEMVEAFGPGIVGSDGGLDRQAVADVVFNDPEALARLNAIVHPRVGEEIANRLGEVGDRDEVVVLDVPLMVERADSPYRSMIAGLIVVDLDPEVAVDRLVRFRGFDEADARARISRQATREERRAQADFLIDNHGDPQALEAEVERCWAWLQELRAGTPAG